MREPRPREPDDDGTRRALAAEAFLASSSDPRRSVGRFLRRFAAEHGAVSKPARFVGIDLHQDSVTLAVLREGATEVSQVETLLGELARLRRFFQGVLTEGPSEPATRQR